MQFNCCVDSNFYFHPSDEVDPKNVRFESLRGRLRCFASFVQKLISLPFALFCKSYKTFLRFCCVGYSAIYLLFTLGMSTKAQEFFSKRARCLANDLADWILFPFAVVTCLLRLILGTLIHPALYYS